MKYFNCIKFFLLMVVCLNVVYATDTKYIIILKNDKVVEVDVSTGEVKKENDTFFFFDNDGNKYVILTGERLSEIFLKKAEERYLEKDYSGSSNYYQHVVVNLIKSSVEEHKYYLLVLKKLKEIEKITGNEIYFDTNILEPGIYALLYQRYGIEGLKKEDYENAEYAFRRSIYYNPEYLHAIVNLGVSLDSQKKYSEAIIYFKQALKLKPDEALVHYNMACSYSMQNKKKLALEHFYNAVQFGYHDKEKIRTDKTLDPIRNTAEFKKIFNTLN